MLRISVLAVAAAAGAEAFAPGSAPLLRTFGRPRTSAASTCATNIVMQRSGRPIDRKDGFGGGFDAIKKKLDERSTDDWGGNGTGGASGKLGGGDTTDFAAYMAKRAAEAGGKVTDAAGNDITDARPTYKVQEGAWGAPEDDKEEDPLDWIDKSVSGFEKQDTDWLKESDDDFKAWKEEKNAKRAEEEAAIEAKMQMWLKAAEEKKRAEGSM